MRTYLGTMHHIITLLFVIKHFYSSSHSKNSPSYVTSYIQANNTPNLNTLVNLFPNKVVITNVPFVI